jgi:HK97 family phage portal protein
MPSLLDRLMGRKSAAPPARPPLLDRPWAMQGATLGLVTSYDNLARDGYVRNPVARRAVRLLAECAASVPWQAMEGGRAAPDHAALKLLAEPNPLQSGPALIEALVSWLELHGNAFLERVDDSTGTPVELYALRPERVQLITDATGWPLEYRYGSGPKAARYPVDPVTARAALLHLKSFHPLDDQFGAGGLEAAAEAIALHNAAAAWNRSLLANAARPSGALTVEGADGPMTLTAEQFERLKAELERTFSGAVNAGRPLILEGGLRWQALSLSPADMDFMASKHGAARDIALAFGVPPMLLGIPGDNTYANYAEANRALWRLTVLPLLTRLAAALTQWLRASWPDLTLSFDRDAIPALAADREWLWAQVATPDTLTISERRRLLGLPPEPDLYRNDTADHP